MKSIYILGMHAVLLLILAPIGCGQREPDTCKDAPYGSIIKVLNIIPSSVSDSSPNISTEGGYIIVSVTDADGQPMNMTRLTIIFPGAVPESPGYVQLYSDTTPVNMPFAVCTDDYGMYIFHFTYQSGGGLNYESDISIISGGAEPGKTTFSVSSS